MISFLSNLWQKSMIKCIKQIYILKDKEKKCNGLRLSGGLRCGTVKRKKKDKQTFDRLGWKLQIALKLVQITRHKLACESERLKSIAIQAFVWINIQKRLLSRSLITHQIH